MLLISWILSKKCVFESLVENEKLVCIFLSCVQNVKTAVISSFQFERGIFALMGTVDPESFDTLHSYANAFEMPFVTPWYVP
jgi:hypothetical protein